MLTAYSLIDWGWLARQIPWIVGLSLLLAGLSWGHWRARALRVPLRELLGHPSYRTVFSLGLTLFALGLALNPTRWWEPYLWGLFSLYFAVETGFAARRGRNPRARRSP